MNRISIGKALVLAASVCVLLCNPAWAFAADGTWSNTAGGTLNWDDSLNWASGTIADGADFTASFTANIGADLTVNLNNPKTIGNITYTDTTSNNNNMAISGGNILTLERSDAIKPTINVTQSNRLLTISSVIAGNDGLLKSGAGTLVFGATSNNTFTGGLDINGGVIRYDSATNANAWGDAGNVITFTGNATLHNNNNAYTLARAITVNSGVTATLSGAFGESTDITGAVTGSGDVNTAAASNGYAVTMSNGANSLSGTVWVTSGLGGNTSLNVNSLADGADATKHLKMGAGAFSAGFTLQGSSVTPIVWTNRAVELAGTTGAISINNNSTSAARTLTISRDLLFTTVSSGNKTLTLGGTNSGDNTFAGIIGNNGTSVTSFIKSGGGKWILPNANTYTGTTAIAGTVIVNTIKDYGTASSLGAAASGAITFDLFQANTISYVGSGDTSNRTMIALPGDVFNRNNNSGISNNGTGALVFTAATFNTPAGGSGNRTTPIQLGGTHTGANVIQGIIQDNDLATFNRIGLTKAGTGTWKLSGANSYTGVTTISGGMLVYLNTSAKASATATAAAAGSIGLGVGGAGFYSSANVDSLFANTLAGFSMNAASGVGIDTTAGDFTYATNQTNNRALTKLGPNTLTLTGNNTYGGGTTVLEGTLLVNNLAGSGTGTGNVTVNPGATLGGSGTISGAVLGAGLVSPGNSPGILTVGQVDTSTGMDYAFEFTATGNPLWNNAPASVNDVLRITNATPFTGGAMDSDNVIDVYLNVTDLLNGQVFNGGFFTDTNGDFLATVAGADYNFFVDYDGGGTVVFEGENYYSLLDFATLVDATITLDVSTLQIGTADFQGGNINNGWVTQFSVTRIANTVVPEPASVAMWSLVALGLVSCFGLRGRRAR